MFSKALVSARRSRKYQEAEASKAELLRTIVEQAEQGHAAALRVTLQRAPPGAVDWADAHGFTPLMHACTEGHAEVVQLLLSSSATLDSCNPQRETALHLASSIGYDVVVRMLVEHGADPSLRTSSGATASDLAASLGHESIVAYLGDSPTVSAASVVAEVGLASAASAGSSGLPDARDTAYALLDAPLAQLSGGELDEIESILQMTLEHIGQLRIAAAAPAEAVEAPATPATSAAAAAWGEEVAPTCSTKNTAALARAKAGERYSRSASTNVSPLGIRMASRSGPG